MQYPTQWMQQRDRHTHTHFELSSQTSFQPEISYAKPHIPSSSSTCRLIILFYSKLFIPFCDLSAFILYTLFSRIIFTFVSNCNALASDFGKNKCQEWVPSMGWSRANFNVSPYSCLYIDMTDSAFSNVRFVHRRMKCAVKGFTIFNSRVLDWDVCNENDWWLKCKHFTILIRCSFEFSKKWCKIEFRRAKVIFSPKKRWLFYCWWSFYFQAQIFMRECVSAHA